MEGLGMSTFWRRRKVFLTGHTGFKGSWLSLWLQELGAELWGYALDPPTNPSLFALADVGMNMHSVIGDLRDCAALSSAINAQQPEIVIHMAAQPLVRRSYEDPLETYEVNVIGTVNLLEVVRRCPSVRAVVVITTDKCYENREWVWPYRENDRLGGHDPYSSSKACAEILTASFRNSFFPAYRYAQHHVALATVRAGNVIGGGDWASDRIIPDMVRAFSSHQVLEIRNPHAIRPWQHVLEPLRGYLILAEKLYMEGAAFAEAWNFGPAQGDAQPVEWIVDSFVEHWGDGARWKLATGEQPHEAQMLMLDWSKAATRLGWSPCLSLQEALCYTFNWYKQQQDGATVRELTLKQVRDYSAHARYNPTGISE